MSSSKVISVWSTRLLLVGAVISFVLANSPLATYFHLALSAAKPFSFLSSTITLSSEHVINDGLMTLFFLLVGLEIKYEFCLGHLKTIKASVLPFIAAAGGMLFPAIIFILWNLHHPTLLRAWAVPTATDIAFSLAIFSLLRHYLPHSLRVFLMALAILDDLGAIIIIAIFYTSTIHSIFLWLALVAFLMLVLLNFLKVSSLVAYLILGVILWILVGLSGVHSTIAGVLVAMTIPVHHATSPLLRLENFLKPWVGLLIVPLFALANAGIDFVGLPMDAIQWSVILGVSLGLLLGKPLGITLISWCAVRCRLCVLPIESTWPQFLGVALLCGIGFTMSLFIGMLAFPAINSPELVSIKIGVVLGSLVSGLLGYGLLRILVISKK